MYPSKTTMQETGYVVMVRYLRFAKESSMPNWASGRLGLSTPP
jgi:hypothetical protein